MDFIIDNYVWFIVGGVLLIMAVIGYFAEKTNFGRNEFERKVKRVPKEKKVKTKNKKRETSKSKKESDMAIQELEGATGVTIDDQDWFESIESIDSNSLKPSLEKQVDDNLTNASTEELFDSLEEVEPLDTEELEPLVAEEFTISDLDNLEEYNSPLIEEKKEPEIIIEDVIVEDDIAGDNIIDDLNSENLPKIEDLNKNNETEDVWKF